MKNKHLPRIRNTDLDNLVSNLRSEVGEIIFSWVLMRSLVVDAKRLGTGDDERDFENPQLATLNSLIDKLSDEIVARLSELAEYKVGRLNFYFAQVKLDKFQHEVADFARFIEKQRFREKRNYDISHKELPEQLSEQKIITIPYTALVKGVAKALRLMKRIDRVVLGPRAKYVWREMRRRRYIRRHPAGLGYRLLPYLWPPHDDRFRIIVEEMREGRDVWTDMPIRINGRETIIKACGHWGAIILGGQIILLDQPFLELTSIDIGIAQEANEHSTPPESGNV